ncbi:MAG: hypothetical protein IK041_09305, partial [Bacteroidales bacterium]|nr:hypothetical protein [Bacteroidales bacterium]
DEKDKGKIAESCVASLMENEPESIVTACPLCYKAIRSKAEVPVKDFAEIVCDNLENNDKN